MNPALNILVVDDEPNIRRTLALHLESRGHRVALAKNMAEGLKQAEQGRFQVAFVDLRLGEQSGLDLLSALERLESSPAVVVITAYASLESAIEAMKRGARDYLPKPFKPAQVDLAIRRICEMDRLQRRYAALKEDAAQRDFEICWHTSSRAMGRTLELVRKVAATDVPVLIRGATGTGKGVVARQIHRLSPRSAGPFVVVSCPAMPAELLESELFGHVRGAFTGASRTTGGKVSLAEGGTIFLDEVADLPVNLQPKLLRFAQDLEYERVGDPKPLQADVRILAATNRNLEQLVESGKFREDLYYRLNVVAIPILPLAERPEDILPLANHFLDCLAARHAKPGLQFSKAAEASLVDHSWKGNVRELRNAVERAAMLSDSRIIEAHDLGLEAADSNPTRIGSNLTLKELEREHIRQVLYRTDSFREAASILGIDEATLWRRRQRYAEEDS